MPVARVQGSDMGFSRMRSRLNFAALALCAAASGCIYFQRPRLDPGGEPICVGPAVRSRRTASSPANPIAVSLRP